MSENHAETEQGVGDHLFSTYAKFSEKITFLTPKYEQVHELIRL